MVEATTVPERLATLEAEIRFLRIEIGGLKALVRWIGFTLGGAVLLAFAQFVLKGGLASVAAAAGLH